MQRRYPAERMAAVVMLACALTTHDAAAQTGNIAPYAPDRTFTLTAGAIITVEDLLVNASDGDRPTRPISEAPSSRPRRASPAT